MKLKKNNIDEKKLKKRLIISILSGVLFVIVVIVGFRAIKYGSRIEEAPTALRHSFEWNQKVWARISSSKHLSVNKPRPDKSKPPRVNGDIGLTSVADSKNYSVEVISGTKTFKLPIAAFHSTDKVDVSTDFRCIEGWSEEMSYAGMRFSDFMKFYDLGKKPDGTYYAYVGLETPDKEYYVSIDIESMIHPQTVLSYEMNGTPLSIENGAPLRLMIPVKYGIKNLKRIGKIFFSDIRPRDYWAERGYDWYSGL
ncbi:MAG: molybdopterin-dependent oxidoreductase [Bacteriovorax sp.]|nr:molybdopterin-dependent oxidoreductase [Bacteriovorax sp.]